VWLDGGAIGSTVAAVVISEDEDAVYERMRLVQGRRQANIDRAGASETA
jgi:hypothetical protein